ncbi:MAG: tetratricopeptide repeat-containing sensor histidine kinase [Bacteroidota bacterium]
MYLNLATKSILLAVLLCLGTALFSQNNTEKTDKGVAFYKKASAYLLTNTDSAIKYANIGLLFINEKEEQKTKNNLLFIIGKAYQKQNKHKNALKYFLQAYQGYESFNDKHNLLATTFALGTVYAKTCYYDKALLYFHQSLFLSIDLKDTMQQCISLINLGTVDYVLKEYNSALKNYEKALVIATKLNSEINIAHIFRCISGTYSSMNEDKIALTYQKQALEVYKRTKNKYYEAVVMADIGDTYKNLHNNSFALKYFEKAYLISTNLDDLFLKSHILFNIGNLYILDRNYEKAKEYLYRAERIAISAENKITLKNIYESFYRYYSIQKNYQQALEYYKRFKETNDSIYSKESRDKVAELEVKYAIQEKENENQILHQRNEIQQLIINKQIYLRNTFIYISIIITLLVIFIIFRYLIKQRANKMLTEKNELINHQKNNLEEAYATKDKLFAIITHDLKNPFGTIISLTSFIEESFSEMDDKHKIQAITTIRKSADSAYELLENLTKWLLSQNKNTPIHPSIFDIVVALQTIVTLYKIETENKNIEVFFEKPSEIYVMADEQMIKTIIRNLFSNAIKFTPVNGRITIELKEIQQEIQVAIKDTGIGIKEGDKDKIFKIGSNFTTIGTAREKGSGLGLILAKEFADRNNSKIWFETKVGKGSNFYFSVLKANHDE